VIEEVRFGFLAGNVVLEQLWEDATSPGRKWHLGKVEMSFPILRLAIEDDSFLILQDSLQLLKRTETTALPELAAGRALWVEGLRENGEVRADRLVVLNESLAGDPFYLKCCR
jgi:hypothetical protein